MTKEKDMGPFAGMDAGLNRAITAYGTPPYRQIKQISIRDVGNYSFDDKLPNTIEGWIKWMSIALKECPTEYQESLRCVLKYKQGYYDSGDSANLSVWYERPETDDEMTERVNSGIAYVLSKDDAERALFERLRKKYEAPR